MTPITAMVIVGPAIVWLAGGYLSIYAGLTIGTIVAFKLIGYFSDSSRTLPGHAFDKIILVAGLVPFVGMLLVLLLVRNNRSTGQGLVRPI